MRSGVKILGILMMMLLLQSTMITCLAEQHPPKIPVRVEGPTASGDVRLRIYPGGWIRVSGYISISERPAEEPAAAIPHHTSYECRYEPISGDMVLMRCRGEIGPEPGGLEDLPEEFRGRLGELKLSIGYVEKFTRSGPAYDGVFTIFVPETLHINGSFKALDGIGPMESSLRLHANITLWCSELNMTRADVEQLVKQFPSVKGFVVALIEKLTEGEVRISDLALKPVEIGDERAELKLLFESRGDFYEGLARFVEKLPEFLKYTKPPIEGGFKPEIPPEVVEAFRGIAKYVRELRDVRYEYAVPMSGNFSASWNGVDTIFRINSSTIYKGDLDKQFAEILRIECRMLEEVLRFMSREVGEEQAEAMEKMLDLAIKSEYRFSESSFKVLTKMNELGETVTELRFRDLWVKPEDLKELFWMIEYISRVSPQEDLHLTMESGATQDKLTLIKISPEILSAAKPIRETRYSSTWKLFNLPFRKLEVEVSENPWRVADLNYTEYRAEFKGVEHVIEVASNSTIASIKPLTNGLEILVSGRAGRLGAMNLTIPKNAVDGAIVAAMDGRPLKARMGMSEDRYWIYLTYIHSLRKIRILWAKPEITIMVAERGKPASQLEGPKVCHGASIAELTIRAGEEVEVLGWITVLGRPLEGVKVDILLDGVPVKSITTSANGSFRMPIKLEGEKTYEINARCKFLDREFYGEPVKVRTYIPIYQKPLLVMMIAVVAVVAMIAVLIIWRTRRILSQIKA